MDALLRFVHGFHRNNNIRALTFIAILITWFAMNLSVFGVTPMPEVKRSAADVYQTFRQFGDYKPLGVAPTGYGFIGRWSWHLSGAWLVFCLVYSPLALRDEFTTALRRARNIYANQTRVVTGTSSPAPTAQPAAGGTGTAAATGTAQTVYRVASFWRIFSSEILAETLGTLAEIVFQRRRP